MEQIQEKITEKIGNVDTKINRVTEQINVNSRRIEEINQRNLVNIREALEAIKNKPIQLSNLQMWESREVINFKDMCKIL